MDDPNMTMEEYIRLDEEKARRRGRVFNWQTATYEKIRVDDDLHDLSSVEAKFPAIVINDAFAPQDTLQCKSQVSTPVNDEIDFRISFDESDDEDYAIICDKNSFSYKMISVNNLKTDLKNDIEKVIPSILSPESAISCFDDLDFFKDFENEFPAIFYNDAQTSKSDLLTESLLKPQHIDKFNLNDETPVSEYDEEEQNILYFNDLFHFNIIHPNNLKLDEDNDNNEINIILSSEGNEIIHGSCVLFETSHDKVTKTFRTESFVINFKVKIMIWRYYANEILFYLIMNLYVPFGVLFDPKRYYKDGDCAIMLRRPRYEGLQYTKADIEDFETRLTRIYRREVHRVQELVCSLAELGGGYLTLGGVGTRAYFGVFSTFRFGQAILDLYTPGALQFQLGGARRRMSWREFILALGLYTAEEMQTAGFGAYWADNARHIPDKGDLRDYWIGISSTRDFLGTAPSYTMIQDPILRLCHSLIACSIVVPDIY
ncbi:hypothetical protein Tco_0551057 [Tanacetum coccineum]